MARPLAGLEEPVKAALQVVHAFEHHVRGFREKRMPMLAFCLGQGQCVFDEDGLETPGAIVEPETVATIAKPETVGTTSEPDHVEQRVAALDTQALSRFLASQLAPDALREVAEAVLDGEVTGSLLLEHVTAGTVQHFFERQLLCPISASTAKDVKHAVLGIAPAESDPPTAGLPPEEKGTAGSAQEDKGAAAFGTPSAKAVTPDFFPVRPQVIAAATCTQAHAWQLLHLVQAATKHSKWAPGELVAVLDSEGKAYLQALTDFQEDMHQYVQESLISVKAWATTRYAVGVPEEVRVCKRAAVLLFIAEVCGSQPSTFATVDEDASLADALEEAASGLLHSLSGSLTVPLKRLRTAASKPDGVKVALAAKKILDQTLGSLCKGSLAACSRRVQQHLDARQEYCDRYQTSSSGSGKGPKYLHVQVFEQAGLLGLLQALFLDVAQCQLLQSVRAEDSLGQQLRKTLVCYIGVADQVPELNRLSEFIRPLAEVEELGLADAFSMCHTKLAELTKDIDDKTRHYADSLDFPKIGQLLQDHPATRKNFAVLQQIGRQLNGVLLGGRVAFDAFAAQAKADWLADAVVPGQDGETATMETSSPTARLIELLKPLSAAHSSLPPDLFQPLAAAAAANGGGSAVAADGATAADKATLLAAAMDDDFSTVQQEVADLVCKFDAALCDRSTETRHEGIACALGLDFAGFSHASTLLSLWAGALKAFPNKAAESVAADAAAAATDMKDSLNKLLHMFDEVVMTKEKLEELAADGRAPKDVFDALDRLPEPHHEKGRECEKSYLAAFTKTLANIDALGCDSVTPVQVELVEFLLEADSFFDDYGGFTIRKQVCPAVRRAISTCLFLRWAVPLGTASVNRDAGRVAANPGRLPGQRGIRARESPTPRCLTGADTGLPPHVGRRLLLAGLFASGPPATHWSSARH